MSIMGFTDFLNESEANRTNEHRKASAIAYLKGADMFIAKRPNESKWAGDSSMDWLTLTPDAKRKAIALIESGRQVIDTINMRVPMHVSGRTVRVTELNFTDGFSYRLSTWAAIWD